MMELAYFLRNDIQYIFCTASLLKLGFFFKNSNDNSFNPKKLLLNIFCSSDFKSLTLRNLCPKEIPFPNINP
jgi:hypothetical protein